MAEYPRQHTLDGLRSSYYYSAFLLFSEQHFILKSFTINAVLCALRNLFIPDGRPRSRETLSTHARGPGARERFQRGYKQPFRGR
jgi:hypothetical protein